LQQQYLQHFQQLPDIRLADAVDLDPFVGPGSASGPSAGPGPGSTGRAVAGPAGKQQQQQQREGRVQRRALFTLKRKFAELTAQIEGSLCEVGDPI
jgi:hypothetical protein